ncbi:sugar transferase [Priestia megaterium]|uniref:sugar transferase n=1 Tax=Priestia megaterium TaxID=1404 RepID=UPI001B39F53F|nr:sugar transferase [Priestia megaterium]MBQ4867826.1 sugar transferase [Priestia megaterium]
MKLPVIAEPKTEAAVQAPPAEKKVNPNNKKGYLFSKRCIDVIGALAGLLVLLIVFIVIGLLIKIEDPKGSIFFSQKRVGKNGKEFNMYKFRSMVSDAEAKLVELLQQNEATGAMFKMKNDPRVTKIGRFIRKTSIDELPQLLNVLKGDMSLVGPRPPLVREVNEYTEYQKQRLLVTPGCTGLWQVSGRSNVGFEEMVELDLTYMTTRSLKTDITIIGRTVLLLFGSKNAY